MAKAHKIVKSDDATTLLIAGDIRNPEPSAAIIKFPGGYVEVSRCSDNSYWVHIQRNLENNPEVDITEGAIADSRIDYTPEVWSQYGNIPNIPAHADIQHIAVRIKKS